MRLVRFEIAVYFERRAKLFRIEQSFAQVSSLADNVCTHVRSQGLPQSRRILVMRQAHEIRRKKYAHIRILARFGGDAIDVAVVRLPCEVEDLRPKFLVCLRCAKEMLESFFVSVRPQQQVAQSPTWVIVVWRQGSCVTQRLLSSRTIPAHLKSASKLFPVTNIIW